MKHTSGAARAIIAPEYSMRLSDDRRISSLYLPSGLSVHSCCGCAWQMNADNDSETKAEIAFNKHRCEHFPIIIRKLNTLPLHVRQSAKF